MAVGNVMDSAVPRFLSVNIRSADPKHDGYCLDRNNTCSWEGRESEHRGLSTSLSVNPFHRKRHHNDGMQYRPIGHERLHEFDSKQTLN